MDKEWRGKMGRRRKKGAVKVIGVSATEGARRASAVVDTAAAEGRYARRLLVSLRISSGWNLPGATCAQSRVPAMRSTNLGSPAVAYSLKNTCTCRPPSACGPMRVKRK